MDNRHIGDRLDSFAALLELSEANPYTIRAYRRAAETIRGAALPVADLVRSGRVRELRGIGPGIEARLRELVETGEIAELAELERELAPDMVGLGRYLCLGARRSIELARSLGVRTAEEFRAAAAAGRLQGAPGIGPKTEARLRGFSVLTIGDLADRRVEWLVDQFGSSYGRYLFEASRGEDDSTLVGANCSAPSITVTGWNRSSSDC